MRGISPGRDRHVDGHWFATKIAYVEVADSCGRRDPWIVPNLKAGGDRLPDPIHLADVTVDIIADPVGDDAGVGGDRWSALRNLASKPFESVTSRKNTQHIGHRQRFAGRFGQQGCNGDEGAPTRWLPEPVGARISRSGILLGEELKAHPSDLVEPLRLGTLHRREWIPAMRSSVLCSRIKKIHLLPLPLPVSRSGGKSLALYVKDNERTAPREAGRNGEAAGLSCAGPCVQSNVFAATKL